LEARGDGLRFVLMDQSQAITRLNAYR